MVAQQYPIRPNGVPDFSTKYGNILQTITVVGLLISGVYVGVLTPLREEIIELKVVVSERISRQEHEEFKLRTDEKIKAVEREVAIGRTDFSFLRESQVTRNEHVTHWEQTKADIMEIRKQIDDLRKDFGGQYTVAEKLKELQSELDQLRMASNVSHVQLNSAPAPMPRP